MRARPARARVRSKEGGAERFGMRRSSIFVFTPSPPTPHGWSGEAFASASRLRCLGGPVRGPWVAFLISPTTPWRPAHPDGCSAGPLARRGVRGQSPSGRFTYLHPHELSENPFTHMCKWPGTTQAKAARAVRIGAVSATNEIAGRFGDHDAKDDDGGRTRALCVLSSKTRGRQFASL